MGEPSDDPSAGDVDEDLKPATFFAGGGWRSGRPSEEQLAYLAAVVDTSNDAIISKSLDGTITSWNASAERIFGYRSEEITGRNIRLLIPAELQAEEDTILSRLRAGEYIEHYETVLLTRQGRRVDVSLSISPIRNRAGVVVGAALAAGGFHVVFPAEPGELRNLRASLRDWLGARDLGGATGDALILAIGEACSNAIEHAYAGRAPGDVKVEIEETPDNMLSITVRDHGLLRAPTQPRADRGRGTALMRDLTLDFNRESTPMGTTVRFRLPLTDRTLDN